MTTLLEMIALEDTYESAITGTRISTPSKDINNLRVITQLPTVNPKKPGTMSFDRFQGYFNVGIECVQDALDNGLRMDDIRHDAAHGFRAGVPRVSFEGPWPLSDGQCALVRGPMGSH